MCPVHSNRFTSPEHGCFEVFPMLPDELQALGGQDAHVPRAVAGR
jgi:hypothetical protein